MTWAPRGHQGHQQARHARHGPGLRPLDQRRRRHRRPQAQGPHLQRPQRHRGRRGVRPAGGRGERRPRSSAPTASTAAPSSRRWRRPASPTSAATASPTTSSPARSPTPSTAASPRCSPATAAQLAARCGRVALVRPDTIAGDELPQLLDSGLSRRAAAPRRRHPGGRGRHRVRRPGRAGAEHDDRAARRTTGAWCPRSATARHLLRLLPARPRGLPDGADRPPCSAASTSRLIDATGGASGPYEGSYITGWYPVASDPRWDGMKRGHPGAGLRRQPDRPRRRGRADHVDRVHRAQADRRVARATAR